MAERLPCRKNPEGVLLADCLDSFMNANSLGWREDPCFRCADGRQRRKVFADSMDFESELEETPVEPDDGTVEHATAASFRKLLGSDSWNYDLSQRALDLFNIDFGTSLRVSDFESMAGQVLGAGFGPIGNLPDQWAEQFPLGHEVGSLSSDIVLAFGECLGTFYQNELPNIRAAVVKACDRMLEEVEKTQRLLERNLEEAIVGRERRLSVPWAPVVVGLVPRWAEFLSQLTIPWRDAVLKERSEWTEDPLLRATRGRQGRGRIPSSRPRFAELVLETFARREVAAPAEVAIGDYYCRAIALLWVGTGFYIPTGTDADQLAQPLGLSDFIENVVTPQVKVEVQDFQKFVPPARPSGDRESDKRT